MEPGWIAFFVIFGIVIVALIVYGIVICVLSNEEYGVTAPSPVEDTLDAEQRKHEFLGYSSVLDELLDYAPSVKEASKSKAQDDHFVKCIDMGPVATDPIPDEILKNYK